MRGIIINVHRIITRLATKSSHEKEKKNTFRCAQHEPKHMHFSNVPTARGIQVDFHCVRFFLCAKVYSNAILWLIVHRYRIFDQMNGNTHYTYAHWSPSLSVSNKTKKNKTHTRTICGPPRARPMCEGSRKYFGILWRDIKLVLCVS